MSALSAARLLTVGIAWRVTGAASAGRALVSALSRADPDDRAVAGMLLTRAGDRSVPLLAEALRHDGARDDAGVLVDVLASIGTEPARQVLLDATRSPRQELAGAAGRALHSLDQQKRLTEPEPPDQQPEA